VGRDEEPTADADSLAVASPLASPASLGSLPDLLRHALCGIQHQAPKEIDSTLNPKLHKGEMQALSLAKERRPDWVLRDDWDARIAVKERNYPGSGTLSVLEEAACRDLLVIEDATAKLKLTNDRATEDQYQAAIGNVRTRKLAQQ
jgi:predicted nucleic acid-binding protein